MPLQLAPVERQDFDRMSAYKFNRDGDLIAPIVPRFWPSTASDDLNSERNSWSIQQQRNIFDNDTTVRFVKVTDTDNDEIVSLGRWHYYENGYQHPQFTAAELNGTQPDADPVWPVGANGPLAEAVLIPILEVRPKWMGQKPQWVLTTLVTKEPQRKRGAGGMIVEWGLKQAQRDNVPAFLEASRAGAPLYEKLGFRRVGETVVHLQDYEIQDPIVLARMAANVDN